MRMRKKPNLAIRMERCAGLLVRMPEERRGNWRALKAEATGLQLELGCGKGRFTAGTAAADRQTGIRGVRPRGPRPRRRGLTPLGFQGRPPYISAVPGSLFIVTAVEKKPNLLFNLWGNHSPHGQQSGHAVDFIISTGGTPQRPCRCLKIGMDRFSTVLTISEIRA